MPGSRELEIEYASALLPPRNQAIPAQGITVPAIDTGASAVWCDEGVGDRPGALFKRAAFGQSVEHAKLNVRELGHPAMLPFCRARRGWVV